MRQTRRGALHPGPPSPKKRAPDEAWGTLPRPPRRAPFPSLPEEREMICNYVVFLELTHPSEARALVDVTADPGSGRKKQ